MAVELVVVGLFAVLAGGVLGWVVGQRRAGAMAGELAAARVHADQGELRRTLLEEVTRERDHALRDLAEARAHDYAAKARIDELTAARADLDRRLVATTDERDTAARTLGELRAGLTEREAAYATRLTELVAAKDALSAQFAEVGAKLLDEAQAKFLARADDRFKQAEENSKTTLQGLIQPVETTLKRYEESVTKVEAERRDAFGILQGQIDAMRVGQESVRSEAAKLVNALRNAPKARGRWGEQQLRNVLESCGLAEHADFHTEVSVEMGEGARLRPDVIVKIPGGKVLVIDAKVSLNAYQDAFGAVDDVARLAGLAAHAASMRAHVQSLGNKAYWNQFEDAPEFVVMFVPGEHFVSAALEHAPDLWDYAFERRVLLATPTNLIAIARTVAAVWRQEKLAGEARAIGELGKELYARLVTMGAHLAKLGRNLELATGAYNGFVGSLESQVLTQARRFETLNIDTGGKTIEPAVLVESTPRALTKLSAAASGPDLLAAE